MNLLFASSNVNKLKEIRDLIPKGYILKSLPDLDFYEELTESTVTLEGNALQKARFVYEKFGMNCFADDSGLEVEALGGRPGINSAFYAGLPRNDHKNIKLLLSELENVKNRNACFRTVIAFINNGKERLFQGKLNGQIALSPAGVNGFGYDPVFIPEGSVHTIAQMSLENKNKISHRSLAIQQLAAYLNGL